MYQAHGMTFLTTPSVRRTAFMWRMPILHALLALAVRQDPVVLRGVAHSADGAPVAGANVFLLETLDGALTDSAGRFVVSATSPRSGR